LQTWGHGAGVGHFGPGCALSPVSFELQPEATLMHQSEVIMPIALARKSRRGMFSLRAFSSAFCRMK
jgi:hypothetical protein